MPKGGPPARTPAATPGGGPGNPVVASPLPEDPGAPGKARCEGRLQTHLAAGRRRRADVHRASRKLARGPPGRGSHLH
eukprot:3241804-Heterocapsa_arctica.AAC.1